MDVIDRKAVLEALDELDSHQTMSRYQCSKDLANTRLGISMAFDVVEAMQTVDAEPVVRCRECVKAYRIHGCLYCRINSGFKYEHDFCSDGKRKDGE